MPDQKLPIVTYYFRGAPRPTGFGYLVERDGQPWCFLDEDQAKTQLSLSGAFQLDRSHLREQPDINADRKLYLYLLEVEKTPQGPKTIVQPSVDFPNQLHSS
jgi:hypothetical protein